MTREEIIRISYANSKNNLTSTDYSIIITNYCLEHGKPELETSQFVLHLLRGFPSLFILRECFMEALRWYHIKYNLTFLYSNPDIKGERILLLIY